MAKDKTKKKSTKPVKLYAIITEGERTEPDYFNSLLGIFGANLKLTKLLVSSSRPVSVSKTRNVTCAVGQGRTPNPSDIVNDLNIMLSNPRTPYEKIYCVFDKDNHSGYQNLKTICAQNPKLFDASSVPSFEYWLCLHFTYHSQNINSQQMETYLRNNHLSNYNKRINFNDFQDKIQVAISNANKSIVRFNRTAIDNPISYVGEALEDLEKEGLINLH